VSLDNGRDVFGHDIWRYLDAVSGKGQEHAVPQLDLDSTSG
jgi:hypothetical protein